MCEGACVDVCVRVHVCGGVNGECGCECESVSVRV